MNMVWDPETIPSCPRYLYLSLSLSLSVPLYFPLCVCVCWYSIGFISTPAFEKLKLFYVQLIKNVRQWTFSRPLRSRPATPICRLCFWEYCSDFVRIFMNELAPRNIQKQTPPNKSNPKCNSQVFNVRNF